MGVPRHWRGSGSVTEGGLGVLRCWWGGTRVLVAVRDDGGSRCAAGLLGRQWGYWGAGGNAVTTAAAMSSRLGRAVDDMTRVGGGQG
jgi:hypothetical protein